MQLQICRHNDVKIFPIPKALIGQKLPVIILKLNFKSKLFVEFFEVHEQMNESYKPHSRNEQKYTLFTCDIGVFS